MERWIKALGIVALLGSSLAHAQEPPLVLEAEKFVAFDEAWRCYYGREVGMASDLVVIASDRDAHHGYDSGAVYTYRYVAGSYVLEAQWFALNPSTANFGGDVDVGPDRVIVGARNEQVPGYSRGAAYIYHHDGSSWSLEQQLLIPADRYIRFGDSVSLNHHLAAVGAPFEFNGAVQTGAVYVWRLGPTVWEQEAVLVPSDATGQVGFGARVVVDDKMIAVSAPDADGVLPGSGAVYVFRDINGVWTQTDKLVGALTSGGHFPYKFGSALDGNDQALAIGSPYYLAENFGAGLVFVYQAQEREWIMDPIVEPSDAQVWGFFGGSLDVEGSRLLVGAVGHTCDGLKSGAAYYFERVGGVWLERAKFTSSDRDLYDNVGGAVAMSSDLALIGAPRHSTTVRGSGAAYLFDLPPFTPVGSAYCPGDGSAIPCPCGNDSPVGEDRGCVNSRGVGAWLEASGSPSVAAANLALYARDLPRYQPCMLFAGPDSLGGGTVFGDGLQCVGGQLVRLGVGMGSVMGTAAFAPVDDLAQTWTAGDTVRIQGWYRDVAPAACGSGFNLTNGVEVVLSP